MSVSSTSMSNVEAVDMDSRNAVETGSSTHLTGRPDKDVPLVMMSAYQYNKNRHRNLPQLPSYKFQYSVWHELRSSTIHGNELKAPRVRDGPGVKEEMFHRLQDDDNQLIHHSKSGKERSQHRNTLENWENTQVASLPYQDLTHAYQRNNFYRILKRLIRVVQLNLAHNELTDLGSLSFPRCEHLNLNHNFLASFKHLPKLVIIRCLNLEFNNIDTVKGLDRLRNTPLESLFLYGNPITFTANYRQKIFKCLPRLKVLDSVPKLESDDELYEEDQDNPDTKSCVIS